MPVVMYLKRTGSDITSSSVSLDGIDFHVIQGIILLRFSSLIYGIVYTSTLIVSAHTLKDVGFLALLR